MHKIRKKYGIHEKIKNHIFLFIKKTIQWHENQLPPHPLGIGGRAKLKLKKLPILFNTL